MINIIVKPAECWDYFQKNQDRLIDSSDIIAENDEFGVAVYIESNHHLPHFTVQADSYIVREECAINEHDCICTLSEIYDECLTAKFLDTHRHELDKDSVVEPEDIETYGIDKDEYFDEDIEDENLIIEERELEIDDAFTLFLSTALMYDQTPIVDFEDIYEDIKEHMFEYMARKHNLKIYRPMILVDDNKEEFYSEYPYEDMEFDDDDNPIYKK